MPRQKAHDVVATRFKSRIERRFSGSVNPADARRRLFQEVHHGFSVAFGRRQVQRRVTL